jgi:hypothetical protein
MDTTRCLNCDAPLQGKFCPNCGQKADSHRITTKHFLMHDILHGVWHFENKILYTIKQSVFRPGYAAIEYIQGKRIRYYNVFYITAVLLGISLFLSHYSDIYYDKIFHVTEDTSMDKLDLVITKYQKIISLCFIPFAAINSYLLFRRSNLNFPEHVIIAGFSFLGVVVVSLITVILGFLEIIFEARFLDFLTYTTPFIFLTLFSITYYQAFRQTNKGIWWKLIAWNLLIIIEFMTILLFSAILFGSK